MDKNYTQNEINIVYDYFADRVEVEDVAKVFRMKPDSIRVTLARFYNLYVKVTVDVGGPNEEQKQILQEIAEDCCDDIKYFGEPL